MDISLRNEVATPAFRYFIFILFACIFLFGFLMLRLMTDIPFEPEYEKPYRPIRITMFEVGGSYASSSPRVSAFRST